MANAYAICRKLANERHQAGFNYMLEALRRYCNPLPHLSEYEAKEARLMVGFIEVLLDQLYPRRTWEVCLEELPTLK